MKEQKKPLKQKAKALKNDNTKPRFSLVPQLALDETIKGFEVGAKKYGVYNYSQGMEYTRYSDALIRHHRAWIKGEDIDESGVHHLALVACNALMLLDNILTNKGIDNRNKVYQKKEEVSIPKITPEELVLKFKEAHKKYKYKQLKTKK